MSKVSDSSTPLHLETNNGMHFTTKNGLHDDLEVWHNPDGLANVLSCGMLTNGGRVVSDSALYSSMFYFSESKGWMEFKKLGCSLHTYDVTTELNSNSPKFTNYSFFRPQNITRTCSPPDRLSTPMKSESCIPKSDAPACKRLEKF